MQGKPDIARSTLICVAEHEQGGYLDLRQDVTQVGRRERVGHRPHSGGMEIAHDRCDLFNDARSYRASEERGQPLAHDLLRRQVCLPSHIAEAFLYHLGRQRTRPPCICGGEHKARRNVTMPPLELERETRAEREADDVRPVEPERRDEAGEAVGVAVQPERLGRVRRVSTAGRVPRDDVELIRELFQLPPPFAAIAQAAVQEQDRRAITETSERDAKFVNVHVLHAYYPGHYRGLGRACPARYGSRTDLHHRRRETSMPAWAIVTLVLGSSAIVAIAVLLAGQLQLRHARDERALSEDRQRREQGASVVAPVLSLLNDADPQRLTATPGTQTMTLMTELLERWDGLRDPIAVFAAGHPSRRIAEAADKLVVAVTNALTAAHWLIHDLPESWSKESLETARADNAEALRLARELLDAIRQTWTD
jgi:hypothetical protein